MSHEIQYNFPIPQYIEPGQQRTPCHGFGRQASRRGYIVGLETTSLTIEKCVMIKQLNQETLGILQDI